MYLLTDLLPYATFGNKKNKAKRKAAEARQAFEYADIDFPEGQDANQYLSKERNRKLLQNVRKQRQLDYIDPLQYREKQSKDKIFAPYAWDKDKPSQTKLGRWRDTARLSTSQPNTLGAPTVGGIDLRPSLSEKTSNLVNKINNKRFKNSLTTAPTSTNVVGNTKSKSGSGGLLIGASLGLAGLAGLALANRRKKEKQND